MRKLSNAQQRAQQGQQGQSKKRAKGSKEQQGQCPQGSKQKSLSKAQKKQKNISEKQKKLKALEKTKKDERSFIEILQMNFLKFILNKRYPEIIYYLFFAFIVPFFVLYGNALFIIGCSIVVKPAIIKSIEFIFCLLTASGGFITLLFSGLLIQHLLVKSSKNNKKVGKILIAIIAICFLAFPALLDLPIMCFIKSSKDVIVKIFEAVLSII